MNLNKIVLTALAAVLAVMTIGLPTTHAQETPEPQDGFINYAYASWVGTGYYRIGDRTIWHLRLPFTSYTLREPEGKKWGIDVLFPITLGLDQFEDIDVNVGSFTFVPGLRFTYAVFDNWQLKPYGQIGVGKDFKGGNWSTIWGYGIKSLAAFPIKYGELQLGNSVQFADHSLSGTGNDKGFSMFEIGLNYRRPVGFNLLNRENNINIYVIHKNFINDLEFFNVFDEETRITELWTFGLVLGAEPAVKILGIPFKGGGITYTYGNGFTGIGFTTGFPF